MRNPLSSPLSLVPAIVPGSRQVGSSQGIGGVRSPEAHLAIKNPNPFNHPNPALKMQPLGSWMKMVNSPLKMDFWDLLGGL